MSHWLVSRQMSSCLASCILSKPTLAHFFMTHFTSSSFSDVVTNRDSTPAERKAAGDRFAKINAAYAMMSGKPGGDVGSGSSKSSPSSSSWTPPHRRSGSYSSSSSSPSPGPVGSGPYSTDWRDYIPNYRKDYDSEADPYNVGDDSFGKIFSDLFSSAAGGAAGAAMGGANIFNDFIDFLESNVDGYGSSSSSGFGGGGRSSSSSSDDAELQYLLQTGSRQEIRNELDDTELVVQQLTSKLAQLKDDTLLLTTDVAMATRYTEKMELQERLDETKARQGVVENYLAKARKRLLKLQTRYKELLVNNNQNLRDDYDDLRGRSSSSGGGRRASAEQRTYPAAGYAAQPSSPSAAPKSQAPSGSGSTSTSSLRCPVSFAT